MRHTAFALIFSSLLAVNLPAADPQLVNMVMPEAKVIAGINVDSARNSPFGTFLLHHCLLYTSEGAKAESPLVKAIAEGRLDDARKLLSQGTDINSANPDGTTALMQAAEGSGYLQNNVPAVQMLLEKNPNLEAEDRSGRTALYRAVGEGKIEAVNLLLAHKADANHRASDGSSPIFAAVTYGKMPALKALLAAGANFETADNHSTTPLIVAAEGTAYMPNNAPFVQILLEKGAKVDSADQQGRSALFRASEEGKTDAVNLLLDQKADPNQKNNNGATPLHPAVTYGRTETVKTLLKHSATVDRCV